MANVSRETIKKKRGNFKMFDEIDTKTLVQSVMYEETANLELETSGFSIEASAVMAVLDNRFGYPTETLEFDSNKREELYNKLEKGVF